MSLSLMFAREETIWRQFDSSASVESRNATELDHAVLSLAQWRAWRTQPGTASPVAAQTAPLALGVWLASEEAAEALQDDLAQLAVIWLHVPRFNDGRHFSNAALLRRMGFRGELRAFGDVLVDQLLPMQRVGYDVAVLRDDQHLDDARAALKRFSDFYQGDTTQPLPAFRRGRVLTPAP